MTERSADYVHAPWTEDQVASLNEYQRSGVMHPFTGRNDLAPDGEDDLLIATAEGWRSERDPEYRQTWAWRWMADRTWEQFHVPWLHNGSPETVTPPSDT